jgi:hypothetical protein
MSHTIDHDVKTAQEKNGDSDHEIHGGKVQVTRKNPHVINAGSRPNC